ncbi:MAG TPA: energy transducer TonB, partial [Saprospiraceae bacterium]|nr:energy transducer TonB [Saprospiraceae bacterium]
MNFELTGMNVMGIFLALVAAIIALIFLVKSNLRSKDPEVLKEEFLAQPKHSPLEGRNKYPALDVFRSSGTYFGVGVVSALLLTLLAFNWTQFEEEVFVPDYSLEVEEDIMVEPPRTTKPPPPPPPPPPPVIEE